MNLDIKYQKFKYWFKYKAQYFTEADPESLRL